MWYLFIDLDGTLLDDSKSVSESTLKVLKKVVDNDNFSLCIMTARTSRGIDKRLKKICKLYILHNGAEIVDADTTIYRNYLTAHDVRRIYRTINGNSCYIAAITDEVYFCNYDAEKYWGIIPNIKRVDFSNFPVDVPKLTLFFPEKNAHINNEQKLQKKYYIQKMDSNSSVIISKRTATKGNAIAFLQRIHSINKSNCIAIGNDYNDISAFNCCGIKVAVLNAESEVREMAQIIIDSNNNRGVEKYLKNILRK